MTQSTAKTRRYQEGGGRKTGYKAVITAVEQELCKQSTKDATLPLQ